MIFFLFDVLQCWFIFEFDKCGKPPPCPLRDAGAVCLLSTTIQRIVKMNPPMSSPTGSQNRSELKQPSPSGFDGTSETRNECLGSMSVDAALSKPFPPFAQQELVKEPYEDDMRRDDEFKERKASSACGPVIGWKTR